MKELGKRAFWITCRVILLAALLFVTPIGLVWFSAKRVEMETASANLPHAERFIAVCRAFTPYPLMPSRVEARVQGARCELALAHGRKEEAMGHFHRELEILHGNLHGETKSSFPFLKYRKGIEAWGKGYRSWIESAPVEPPDFDRAFLPRSPHKDALPVNWGEAEEAPRRRVAVGTNEADSIREFHFRARRGESLEEIGPFLDQHSEDLEQAQKWADSPEVSLTIEAASDAIRILLLDFLHCSGRGDETGASKALERCGRMLRTMERRPSIAALLVTFALREDWLDVIELAADRFAPSPTTRQSIVKTLTFFSSDTAFPEICLRHEYADSRKILTDAYLDGSWETASPAGKRLYVRHLELLFKRFQQWSVSLSHTTTPEASGQIVSSIINEPDFETVVLAQRPVIVELCYSRRELTEADGRRYGQAIDEAVVARVDAERILKLGRLGEGLHDLRSNEVRLIREFRAKPAP